MSDKEQVFSAVKLVIVDTLPDVQIDAIEIQQSLKDLGANSIDRMEIVTESMESLGVKIPLMDFADVANIEGMVDVLLKAVLDKQVA